MSSSESDYEIDAGEQADEEAIFFLALVDSYRMLGEEQARVLDDAVEKESPDPDKDEEYDDELPFARFFENGSASMHATLLNKVRRVLSELEEDDGLICYDLNEGCVPFQRKKQKKAMSPS